MDSCQDIAQRLRLPGSKDSSKNVFNLLARWLYNEENGPWLLVIDGADISDIVLSQDPQQEPKIRKLLSI